MFNPFQKGIREHESINLSVAEKNSIKESLVSFMQYHPVKPVMHEEMNRLHNHRSILEVFNLHYKKAMPIALIIALMLSGSVSFAAESALPGDVLYPVKVNINEKARGIVKLDAESKAEWEAALADRRLDEAEKLALSGDLKADLAVQLEQKFDAHAEKAEERIDKLEAAGKTEAAAKLSSALEVTLAAHERVIANLNASTTAGTGADNSTLIALGLLVDGRGKKIENMREKIADKIGDKTEVEIKAAAEGRIGAAENKLESSKKFVELKKETIGADAYAKASAHLASSTQALVDAKAKLAARFYKEAIAKATLSMKLAQEAKAAVTIHLDLDKRINFRTIINGNATTSLNNGRGEGGLNLNLGL